MGSGAGGSVVASRLSEIAHWNVLLIEAGKPETFLTDIPAMCGWYQLTDYSWPYKMMKQDNACLGKYKLDGIA